MAADLSADLSAAARSAATEEEDCELRACHGDVVREEEHDVVGQVPAVLALPVAPEGRVVARGGGFGGFGFGGPPSQDGITSSRCSTVRHRSVVQAARQQRRWDGAVAPLVEPLLRAVHGEVQAEGAEQHEAEVPGEPRPASPVMAAAPVPPWRRARERGQGVGR